MNETATTHSQDSGDPTAFAIRLAGAGAALLALAGGLLWWREGEKLFTDGLIAAIARCF